MVALPVKVNSGDKLNQMLGGIYQIPNIRNTAEGGH